MKSLIVALFAVLSSSAFASVDVIRNADCRELVAKTAVMVTNHLTVTDGTLKSVDAPIDSVEYMGSSATMFISQTGDKLSIIAGKDMWSSIVTRVSSKGTEVFTYGATTRTDNKGQCLIMEITMLDRHA